MLKYRFRVETSYKYVISMGNSSVSAGEVEGALTSLVLALSGGDQRERKGRIMTAVYT